MENYSKLIEEIIKKLDWSLIMKYYEIHGEVEEPVKKSKRINVKIKNLYEIKKELKDLLKFILASNILEIQHECWIVSWKNPKLEVVFAPTKIACNFLEEEEEEEIVSAEDVENEMEIGVLTDMLEKSILEENYELSAVVNSRLKKLKKKK